MQTNEFEYLYGHILALHVFLALLLQLKGRDDTKLGEAATQALKSLAAKLPKDLDPLAAQRQMGLRDGLNSLHQASQASLGDQKILIDHISEELLAELGASMSTSG